MNSNIITLITGTSRGIGYGLANHYLSQGHTVIGCSRGESTISHENYTHFQLDVSDEKNVRAIFTHVKKNYKKLDNLINNAGIGVSSLGILTDKDVFENVIRVNTIGSFLFIREAAKIMIKNNYGRIVNFTSGAVPINLDGAVPYTVSKAAVEMMTKSFAQELAPYHITVNAVGPGVTDTNMLATYTSNEKYLELLQQNFLIKENSTIEDLANITDFFLKKESSHITSQILYLCGPR